MSKISLIIPSNSTSFYVEDLLINISLWSLKPQEIILINTTQEKFIIKKQLFNSLKHLNIKLIIINKKGCFPGAARNFGIKKATGDFIAFIDMNTLPYNNRWLEINYNYINKNKLDGIYGQTYYLTSNYKEEVIKSCTYGNAYLTTIPGSIFKKKVIKGVGLFNKNTRAGEDTDWIKRLNLLNFNIKVSKEPIYYKGLFNIGYIDIIIKWFRNYKYSSKLPHLSTQKNFYSFIMFVILFLFFYNLNEFVSQWKNESKIYFPHITKIFLAVAGLFYTILRGIYIPLRKNINLNFLFPVNFIIITFFSFILDAVKTLVFFYSVLRYQKNK